MLSHQPCKGDHEDPLFIIGRYHILKKEAQMSSGPIYILNQSVDNHYDPDHGPFNGVYFKTRAEAENALKRLRIFEEEENVKILEVRPTTVFDFIESLEAHRLITEPGEDE